MFQCDPSLGTDHLRTRVSEGEKIISELWGQFSGIMIYKHRKQ
jgi:lysine 2,3-aminomutase